MSAICQNFVQNAWKKELCSNCFKSKDEHLHLINKLKPLPSTDNKPIESIIKTNKIKPKRSVCFTNQLSEIIGYGGEDWSSDNEEPIDDSPEKDFETEEEDDEEDLCRLTKANTDFNTNSLAEVVEVKKSYTQLMLGKPQLDAEGKKQTLLVSVTPFGQENTRKFITKPASHIPIAKNNKETIAETKSPNIVLKSYMKNGVSEEKSLLDEISETLENGSHPIQIITRKKEEVEVKGDGGKEETEQVKKVKNGLNRAPVILKRDQEKPVISTAKIELMNTRNAKFIGKVDNSRFVNKPAEKPEVNTKPEIKEEATIVKSEEKNEDVECKLAETSSTESEISERPVLAKEPEPVPKFNGEIYPQSREQAGEPDGRAEPDLPSEPPALPLTPPPPLEMQTSFLHGTSPQTYEKPKVPSKPVIIPPQPAEIVEKIKLSQQDPNSSECARNKRRAPKPPEETLLYARNSNCIVNVDCPVVREKDKHERASSCSPKLQKEVDNQQEESNYASIPEPIPRKSLSMSIDNLVEEKQKEKAKARFSLKKFLRISKHSPKLSSEIARSEDVHDGGVKPRLVIVHPLDLSGTKVEVVSKPSDYEQPYSPRVTAAKPPPPPRNLDNSHKPANLPTPPKSAEILFKQRNFNRATMAAKKVDTVYANIGEVRSAITPHKPQRTASMREREEKEKQKKAAVVENYEQVNVGNRDYNENVYDYINNGRSSSPEYDATPDNKGVKTVVRANGLHNKRSESSIDVSGESLKFSNIPRSLSLTYCGSETESEIYSPYSFYGSESEVTEDDHDWISPNSRTHKLRSRKGRSIVHKNLEDNYGAVIVANHEALAQVLENIQQTSAIQPALRGLKLSPNLQWSDFVVKSTNQSVLVGSRVFHQALWGAQPVTLVISTGSIPTSSQSLGTFTLTPITEFSDIIPAKYLAATPPLTDDNKQIQATIAVLPWMQINTIQSYGEMLKTKSHTQDDTWKDGSFILLQLVNALKMLQAQGIEELPLSLTSFVLCREVDKDVHFRLFVLQGLGEDATYKTNTNTYGTLCTCASKALAEVLPTAKTTQLIQSLLNTERAVSLTQVKSVLEFSLWGPSDVALGNTIKERELALQRWLDLQRATVLHGLVCTRVQLTVYEESHLLFLVRSNSRMMCDASLLLESSNMQQAATTAQAQKL